MGSSALDSAKSLRAGGNILDRYKFTLTEFYPDGNRAIETTLLTTSSIVEYTQFLQKAFTDFMTHQENIVRNTVDSDIQELTRRMMQEDVLEEKYSIVTECLTIRGVRDTGRRKFYNLVRHFQMYTNNTVMLSFFALLNLLMSISGLAAHPFYFGSATTAFIWIVITSLCGFSGVLWSIVLTLISYIASDYCVKIVSVRFLVRCATDSLIIAMLIGI
jgi:hypothetical protein